VDRRRSGEALHRAKEFPDLITLDINLPDIDGF
jgi:CheY-like chemotaxis protein